METRYRSVDHAVEVIPASSLAAEAAEFVHPLRAATDLAAGDELDGRLITTFTVGLTSSPSHFGCGAAARFKAAGRAEACQVASR